MISVPSHRESSRQRLEFRRVLRLHRYKHLDTGYVTGETWLRNRSFDRLRIIIRDELLSLVVPEVICLELEAQMRSVEDDVTQKMGQLKKAIKETAVWSEVLDTKEVLLHQLDSLRKAKIDHWKRLYQAVLDLLSSSDVSVIPFSPEIMCSAKRRIMRGGMPRKSDKLDQDAAIIESLVRFFADLQDPEPVLLFCSENHSDFALELGSPKSRDRRFALHPCVAEDLPVASFHTTLADLLELDKGYESIPDLPTSDEIREAMDRVDTFESQCDYDSDYDGHVNAIAELETLCDLQREQHFTTKIAPTLPGEVGAKREILVQEIQNLLKRCRESCSWDDRSEYKLPQWMDHVHDQMIPHVSLLHLQTIKENLERYLSIHQEMDKESD